MKFIKTADGWYIDQSQIDSLCIGESCENMSDNAGAPIIKATVFAYSRGLRWRLKEFSCCPEDKTKFDSQAEAQAWLDKFVAELNGENNEP